jgi:hypothetical protein
MNENTATTEDGANVYQTIHAANRQSRARFSTEVNVAVTFYAYGFCDGSLTLTSDRVQRFLYDYLERAYPVPASADSSAVIHAAGQFIQTR